MVQLARECFASTLLRAQRASRKTLASNRSMRGSRDAPAAESLFERSGAPRIPALAHFLLQSSHLPFQAFDSIERIVEAGGVQRLQEGPDGCEDAAKFPLLWDRMVRCVCHQRLLRRWSRGSALCRLLVEFTVATNRHRPEARRRS